MKPEVRLDLHRRTLDALNGTRPEGRAAPGEVPVDRYLDGDRTERELALLRHRPQPVAASSELPAAGAWLARDRLGIPLLLVRQEDGAVHAFLNVCRHRGARLLEEGGGDSARAFVCPYHAWTYRLDGTLKGLPQAFGFPCLNKAESGLRRLAARERAGLIWVIGDPDLADSDIDIHLDPLMDELEALDLSTPVAYAPRHYEVAANWKLLVDGSLEAYHFKVAHRDTIAHLFTDNLQIIDEAGLNRRLYLVKSNLDPANPPDADRFEPRRHGNILYFFFPNTTVLVQPDHAQFSTLEPLGPGRTRVHEITLLPAAPDSDKAERYWQANVDLYRRTLAEDYSLSESIQKGLSSGANRVLTFGTFEYSAPRFHRQLEAQLGAPDGVP
ncbi:MAG: phenylpropionate dioxygenase-like ring-hydroxylating dioxygenase large terminal subunit [Alloalcanivorax sp.]|jgi:phenylpropionate dioxygenase-like ring-hydroxylating dioxygenase large terminal subunit